MRLVTSIFRLFVVQEGVFLRPIACVFILTDPRCALQVGHALLKQQAVQKTGKQATYRRARETAVSFCDVVCCQVCALVCLPCPLRLRAFVNSTARLSRRARFREDCALLMPTATAATVPFFAVSAWMSRTLPRDGD